MSFQNFRYSDAVYDLINKKWLLIEESMSLLYTCTYLYSAAGSVGAEGSSDLLGTGTKPEELSPAIEYFGVS